MQEAAHNELGIAFSRKSARVLIYKSTLRSLGQPKYIRILPNPKRRRLALQVCAKDEMGAILVPKTKARKPIIICSLVIQRIIWDISEWDKDKSYRIYGKHFPKNEIVEFLMEDAEVIPDELFVDPECTNQGNILPNLSSTL